jgi:1-acyl-sn-glycerol-3-phosphate acyltransferase
MGGNCTSAPEDRLIDRALTASTTTSACLARDLEGLDPDALGFEGWQALLRLEQLLDPASSWAVRVKGLRRRSHYAATLAAADAARISAALCAGGIDHAVFADLALATGFGLEPGMRAVDSLSIWTDPGVTVEQLLAALATVPDLRPPTVGESLLRTSIGGIAIGIHRGWPASLGKQRGPLARPPVTWVTTQTGAFPVVAPQLEAYRLLLTPRDNAPPSWLLDLQTVAAAAPDVWQKLPDIAAAAERSSTLRRTWDQAASRGVGPVRPILRPDPPRARIAQWRRPAGPRGRLDTLTGEVAARPDHGPWPALYDAALAVVRVYVGVRITRIDEGGSTLLMGTEPIIMAANQQDRLDFDTLLVSTPRARRRKLRYVANEKVLAELGTGQGLLARSRAALLRGVYTHVHRVIPVREHIRGRAAVTAMIDALAAGDTVVIFPEGVVNQHEQTTLAPLKRGIAVLALETGVPILPVRIDGTRGKFPINRGRLIRTKPQLTVRYRRPVHAHPGESTAQVLARLAAALAPPGRGTQDPPPGPVG